MLKKSAVSALLLLMPLLCGCMSGRKDFREIEKLELIRTIGIDVEKETVTVSAATGAEQSKMPTILTNSAYTVGLALRQMQTLTDKDIYFAHVDNCLVGEETARQGMSMYLDFIERELSVRYTTGLFVVQDGTAESIITKVGDEGGYVTELLQALKKDVKMLSEEYVYSVGEVGQSMLENDYALIAAVKLVNNEGIVSGGGKINVEPSGYALIRGDRLERFIDKETSHGVNILTNKTSTDTIEAEDGTGGICALSLVSAGTEYSADYGDDGVPTQVDIKVKLTANIEELHDTIDVYDEKVVKVLSEELRRVENERTEKALDLVKELGLDFAGIGSALEMKHPVRFAKIKDRWPELLGDMKFNIRWDITIARTYDLGEPLGHGGENGGSQ